ncbi:inactive transglutaminase family protein [Steroidobacter sp. S1-65]|uniref:Inactive transglutaminase family protein n=1 Tax=Steroidobacter gossypii TaxID=2805490 RepID=A0ABS1X5C1_9GAMM|nr:inactive transglutaminase family protein [Steroidobacter gossypii]MBM0108426.1 inactive transglutaminase family protein [Steroidobacter gossypii]
MNNRHIYVLSAVLALMGLALFAYKSQVLGFPLRPLEQTRVWTIEAAVRFDPGPAAVKATLRIPSLTPGYSILDENFISRGFGHAIRNVEAGRESQWTLREARGPQTLYYRAQVYRDVTRLAEDTTPPFPEQPVLDEPSRIAMEGLIAEVRRQSADVASFTTELLRHINHAERDPYVSLFMSRGSAPSNQAELATIFLAGAQIPARIAHGIQLRNVAGPVQSQQLLEVHDGVQWLYFNPKTLEQGLPPDFLIWWRGDDPIASLEGGGNLDVTLAVQQNLLDSMVVAERRAELTGSHAMDFSLFALPIATQAVYAVLMMIPIGALVIMLLRNFIGVKTFGTFMPVLVALAFRETQLLWGIVLFAVIVSLGLLIRFYLEKLRLLLVPRLTTVLTVVVILMAGISVLSQKLEIQPGLSIALFPMVILSMTIERMSIVWEERGASEALQEGIGSLIVAAVAYVIMGLVWLEHLIFVFPELLLLVIALSLLAGRYTGYRLLELRRFKALLPSRSAS